MFSKFSYLNGITALVELHLLNTKALLIVVT